MSLRSALLGTALVCAALASPMYAKAQGWGSYQHVLLISVDGMHALDLTRYLDDPKHAKGALARLAQRGRVYPNAMTTAPSDSFPGMIAQATGGTPKSAGVFYDDSYDRTLFAPGSNCQGDPGTEVQYAENIDRDQSRLDAGGTLGQPLTQIDPAKLPLSNASGTCQPVYPHQFIRVNTIFEVIKAHGGRTAWSDKHPAYDILNGPSGAGIDDLYTPEINSLLPGGGGKDYTGSYTGTQRYDQIKVQAVLNEIAGLDSTGQRQAGVPTILGMNFQSVSVAQKLAVAGPTDPPGYVGGYADAAGTPNNALAAALDYVDGAIGSMLAALEAQGLRNSTLVIVSAKHGQSPIDRSLRVALDDSPYTATPGYGFHIADDEALVWLKPQTRAANLRAAVSYLNHNAAKLGVETLLRPYDLKEIYRNPAFDSRTPDFITVVKHGVIYTGGTKLAEHGGFADDDRNVALLVSAPDIGGAVNYATVQTAQIAPTILSALGLDPNELQAVRIEGTQVLPRR